MLGEHEDHLHYEILKEEKFPGFHRMILSDSKDHPEPSALLLLNYDSARDIFELRLLTSHAISKNQITDKLKQSSEFNSAFDLFSEDEFAGLTVDAFIYPCRLIPCSRKLKSSRA